MLVSIMVKVRVGLGLGLGSRFGLEARSEE